MPTQADRFQRLVALFERAAPLEPDARHELIAAECGDDRELMDELQQMLAHDTDDSDPDPVGAIIANAAEALVARPRQGTMLGSWRVLLVLGEGGMGTVYLAERADGEFESMAAIKLVDATMAGSDRHRRFRAERQILARLTHPGIARLLDGGTTDDGTPYLVMEYVEGQPITAWCEERGLSLRAKLELFVRVCEAVASAHQSLIAHLDLKPSNVFVDEQGTVKLLDFGLAKLIGTDHGDAGSDRAMTPAYASPEQLRGDPTGVSADVYSLGALLYELLTGRVPLDVADRSLAEAIQIVSENVPRPASAFDRQLRGDLDAIVAKSLEKLPEQRYGSVQALIDDVRRHLDGFAVLARGRSSLYRATRFVRRNWIAVTAATTIVVGSLGFARYAQIQSRALAEQRDEAEQQRATAHRVSKFLQSLLVEADPGVGADPKASIREVLDRGAARLATELEDEPEIRAELELVVGQVYRQWGEYDAAEPFLDRALAFRLQSADTDPIAAARAELERAALAYDRGKYEDAKTLVERALARNAAAPSMDESLDVDLTAWLAVVYAALEDLDRAKELNLEALEKGERIYGRPHAELAESMVGLADVLRERGEWDEAHRWITVAIEDLRALHGDRHLDVAHALNHRSQVLNRLGRSEQALEDALESLDIRRTVLGGPHVEIGASLGSVSGILAGLGRLEEAETKRRESLAEFRGAVGDEHAYVAATLSSLGQLLIQREKWTEAEQTLREAIVVSRKAHAEDHPNNARPLVVLGRLLTRRDRAQEAEPLLREAVRLRRNALPARDWTIGIAERDLGAALDALGRPEEAERHLLDGYALLSEQYAADSSLMADLRALMRDHYERRGLTEKAVAYAD